MEDQPNLCWKLGISLCCSLLQACSSRSGGQSSSSRPSDEQGSSDLSQPPAVRQWLQETPSTPPPPTALLMEDEPMDDDLELLLAGPNNEKHLDECLGDRVAGVLDSYSPQLMEDQFDSLTVNDDDEAVNELEIKDYIDPSMLGCFLPSGSLGHGRRGPRMRSSSERIGLFAHNFGSQEPSTSRGRKHRLGRKNNDHWTEDEVRQLVKGVSFHGVGKWSYVKRKYFHASIRTSAHLKDKWKNLVKSYKKENGKTLLHLEQSLIERIKEIDANVSSPKQSNSDEDRRAPISPNISLVSSPSLLVQWSTMKTRTKKGSMHKLKNNKEDTTINTPI